MRREGLTMKTAICLVVLVLAAGCGQKGPLERPQDAVSAVSPAVENARVAD
jgi:predicted small lipoprotein YifL